MILLSYEIIGNLVSFLFLPILGTILSLVGIALANRVSFKELFMVNLIGLLLVYVQFFDKQLAFSSLFPFFDSFFLVFTMALIIFVDIVLVVIIAFFSTIVMKAMNFLIRGKLRRLGV
jgi:hypothetical protein